MQQNPQGALPPVSQAQPVDQEAREIIRDRLDDTLFVEASAGTGKTTSLVERMVNLVATGRTTLDRIAAITFTEAAAAELRDRVRQRLEEAAADPAIPGQARNLCRQGVADLDQATVCTLHAFAAHLLHERPLEAGLPPGFDTSDEIVAGLKFAEEWEAWLDQATSGDSPLDPYLSLALALGGRLDDLRQLALSFHRNYADLEAAAFAMTEPPPPRDMHTLAEGWAELERLSRYSNDGPGDPLYDHVLGLREPLRTLASEQPGSFGYFRRLNRPPANFHQPGQPEELGDETPINRRQRMYRNKGLCSRIWRNPSPQNWQRQKATRFPESWSPSRSLSWIIPGAARERGGPNSTTCWFGPGTCFATDWMYGTISEGGSPTC